MEQTRNKAKCLAYSTEQSFQHGWKSSRPLQAFEDGQITCTHCVMFVKQCWFGSKENYDNLKNRNKFLTGCTNCYITWHCVYHFCYCVLSSFCPLSVRPSIPLSYWHHNMASDFWFVTWTIITLNFTGITLAIVFQQYMHIISPKNHFMHDRNYNLYAL